MKSIVLDSEIHQIKYSIQTTIIPFRIRKLAIKRNKVLCEFPKGRINMGNGKAFLVNMAIEKGLQNLIPV